MVTDIDYAVIGSRLLDKEKQENRPLSETEKQKWLMSFELD